ncbi:MAG: M20/M25/M40 family metallo-hydrolase [Sulfolobales archaeon]
MLGWLVIDPLELLKRLIPLRCVNDPSGGVKPGSACVEGVLDAMKRSGMDPKSIESNGFYTLFDIYGSGRPVVLYLAHYDVVPPGPSWSFDPFTPVEREGRLYGRGSADDLGNVASIASAYRDMTRVVDKLGGTLVVAFTGDEEIGGYNYLRNKALFPDFLVNGDGAGLVVINRRRSAFKIVIEAEAARIKTKGSRKRVEKTLRSASYHAAYFISGSDVHPLIDLAREVSEQDLLLSSLGGDFVKSNVLPQRVWAEVVGEGADEQQADLSLTELVKTLLPLTRISVELDFPSLYGVTATPNMYYTDGSKHVFEVDVRAPLKDSSKLERAVKNLLEDLSVRIRYRVSGGGGYLNTPRTSRIVSKALRILERMGLPAKVVERAGASDSRYFSPEGVESIDFGPVGGNVHGYDEYVEIWSLERAKRFYIDILGELLSKE